MLHQFFQMYKLDMCPSLAVSLLTYYCLIIDFLDRITLEPITFTFTTPPPKVNQLKHFPTLRPFNPTDFTWGSLPAPSHNSLNNNQIQGICHASILFILQSSGGSEFKYEVQMPTQPRPFEANTPVYSQAQLYVPVAELPWKTLIVPESDASISATRRLLDLSNNLEADDGHVD